MTRVLYIFAGQDRRQLEEKVLRGESPDTPFFGYRHIASEGFETSYLQITKALFGSWGSVIRRFALVRSLYVLITCREEIAAADAIVVASSAYFALLFFTKLGFFRTKRWILFNLDLSIIFKKIENKPWQKKFLLSILRDAAAIICVSRAQREDLIAQGLPPDKVPFVPLGVDASFYKKIESSREIVLTIGRDAGRDIPTFLKAVALSGEPTVMICSPHNVAGREHEIPENLTLLFDQPYAVLKEYYAKAKAFVIATKPAEELAGSDCPGQTSILDTLAYGLPVIATAMPWFEGYFESGRHLMVVPPHDPQALSEAIGRVARDPELALSLSREARVLIEEKCNSEAMGKHIATIIRKVVSANS